MREEEENKPNQKNSESLNDLPDEILQHILSLLPIKSIAQTSLLSKRWSYLWSSFPILDFSKFNPFSRPENISFDQSLHHRIKAMESIITTVLDGRHENSNIKAFRVDRFYGFSCLDDHIRRVVKHRVEELVLEFSSSAYTADRFDLPRCVFECDSLRTLRLRMTVGANWGFPCSYVGVTSGLRSLHTLSLTNVEFLHSANLVVDLFSTSSFPSLVNLTVYKCKGITHLKISCANLEYVKLHHMGLNSLDISGMRLENLEVSSLFNNRNNGSRVNIFAPNLQVFKWVNNATTETCSIQSFPTLKTMYMKYYYQYRAFITMKMIHYFALNLLSASSQVQKFTIRLDFIQILSKIYFEGGLPYSFMKLKTLRISTIALERHDIPGLACLFKSSPTLHTLKIKIPYPVFRHPPYPYRTTDDKWKNKMLDDANCTEEQYWNSQAQSLSPFLSQLKVVKISVSGDMIQENVINIARFLLEHGSGLQDMILISSKYYCPSLWENKMGLFEGFSRASVDVKICLRYRDSIDI